MSTPYRAYAAGYRNGVQFAYMPDWLTPALMVFYATGYADAKSGNGERDPEEIDAIGKANA
jgi:hypothetical protein